MSRRNGRRWRSPMLSPSARVSTCRREAGRSTQSRGTPRCRTRPPQPIGLRRRWHFRACRQAAGSSAPPAAGGHDTVQGAGTLTRTDLAPPLSRVSRFSACGQIASTGPTLFCRRLSGESLLASRTRQLGSAETPTASNRHARSDIRSVRAGAGA